LLLKEIMNKIQIGIIKVDIGGKILYANKVFKKTYKIKKVQGENIRTIIPDSNIINMIKNGQKAKINQLDQKKFAIEFFSYQTKKGVIILFNEENIIDLYDIINDLYEDLVALIDLSDELVTITNEYGEIIRASASAKALMGITKESLKGKSVYSLQNDGVLSSSSTIQVLNTKRKCEITQLTHSGNRLLVRGFPILDKRGDLKKVINLSKDITEKKILEKSLLEKEKIVNDYSQKLKEYTRKFQNIAGYSKSMQETYEMANNVASKDVTILLLGETGVGKSFLAHEMQKWSTRREKPFIKVSCGSIPDNLIETELFGYSKGAFTGADTKGKKGFFLAANGGTIFLDEIGEIPLNLQVKLLEVLQEKEITPVGSTTPLKVDVRIIAATNKNLKKMVQKGLFRSDLYYRLNIVPITVPPLRERKLDIPYLSKHYLDRFNKKYNLKKEISDEVIRLFMESNWEGNIRELRNIIERIVVTSSSNKIDVEHLNAVANFEKSKKKSIIEDKSLKNLLDSYEKEILLETWESANTLEDVSQKLSIDISTVSRKFKKHGIKL